MIADHASEDSDVGERAARPDVKSPPRRRLSGIGRLLRLSLARWRPILLTVLLVAATGWAAGLFYFDYRPDRETDKAVAHEVIRAASDGAVALLSYSPDSLSRDIDNAKSRVTEDFRASYKQFVERIVAPSAQQGQVTTTVRVVRAAATELHPNRAVVLAFIRQNTRSKEKPEPVSTSSSVRISLTKVDGSWLINKFDSL